MFDKDLLSVLKDLPLNFIFSLAAIWGAYKSVPRLYQDLFPYVAKYLENKAKLANELELLLQKNRSEK